MCNAEDELSECEHNLHDAEREVYRLERAMCHADDLLEAISAHFGHERGDEPFGVSEILRLAYELRISMKGAS